MKNSIDLEKASTQHPTRNKKHRAESAKFKQKTI